MSSPPVVPESDRLHASDLPRLRDGIQLVATRSQDGREVYAFVDAEGLTTEQVAMEPAHALAFRTLLDGTRDAEGIARAFAEAVGEAIAPSSLDALLRHFDEKLFLEGERADEARDRQREAYRRQPHRPAAFAGRSYAADPATLRGQVARWRGLAAVDLDGATVESVIAPHIDLRGGARCHGAALEALAACPAELFVLLATAHGPVRRPFALTRHDFATPLGTLPTDVEVVDRLADAGGEELFEDERAHGPEHAVEFPAVWIKALNESRPEVRIVPLLVGSIQTHVDARRSPRDDPRRAAVMDLLRDLRKEMGSRVAFVASVDLAHVGPSYDDPRAPDAAGLEAVLDADRRLLDRAAAVDAEGFFEVLCQNGNAYHVCGAAPTYVFLDALRDSGLRGELLRHDVWEIDPGTGSHVSFAAMAMRPEEGARG